MTDESDGKPAALLKYIFFIRRVQVPSGTCQIECQFLPKNAPLCSGLTAIALALGPLGCLALPGKHEG